MRLLRRSIQMSRSWLIYLWKKGKKVFLFFFENLEGFTLRRKEYVRESCTYIHNGEGDMKLNRWKYSYSSYIFRKIDCYFFFLSLSLSFALFSLLSMIKRQEQEESRRRKKVEREHWCLCVRQRISDW